MVDMMMTTALENIVETDEVALDVGIGIGDRITHTCLSSKIDDHRWLLLSEEMIEGLHVGDVTLDKLPVLLTFVITWMKLGRKVVELLETFELNVHVVIVVQAIDTDDSDARHIVEQALDEITPDESCSTGYQYGLAFERNVITYHIRKCIYYC